MNYRMKYPLEASLNPLRRLLLGVITMLLTLMVSAQDIPEPPNPPRLVNDFANILSAEQINGLERKLVDYNDTTSTQIVVVTVNELKGYDPADFAYRLGEKWGVGQKDKNNGAVILVKPKTGNASGKAFIALGYGLEATNPDALAKRIVETEMIPAFKQGDYYGGINNAVNTIILLSSGEYKSENVAENGNSIWVIIVVVIFIILFLSRSKGGNTHIGKGGSGSGSLWTALWLASMANRNSSGSWGGFSGGSGGFGGGGGGGFGGFGGGSFGGGGAGGSW